MPTEDHLRDLLHLYLQKMPHSQNSQAMATMRDLWIHASERHASHPSFRFIQSFEEAMRAAPGVASAAALGPQIDWGDALTVPIFYGRQEEQALLFRWIVQEHCHVVSVLGMGGIGKSALSVHIMHQLSEHFETIIFRSLRDAPSCEELVGDCLQVLSSESLTDQPATLEQRISLLLARLHCTRALIVLDNLECLLEAGDIKGQFRPDFLGYGQLLRRVAESVHQSCLLLTSREKPIELRPLEGRYSSVRSLRLSGLDIIACRRLLEEKEIVGTEEDTESLIKVYGGNPLALKVVAETIIDLFGGEIGPFLLGSGMVLFGNITDLLGEQFARLSTLEQHVLCWLAIVREPVTIDELLALLVTPLSHVQVLEAVDASHRRSLIERGKRPGSFTLQSVVLEYITGILVAQGNSEIQSGRLDWLIKYGLELAHAKEYVRQTQERLLLCPLLMNLQSACPRRDEVEWLLCSLLDQIRGQADYVQGYGPANLIALLRLHRGHLSGLDLSGLAIRGAYLQSVKMHDTKLCGAQIRDSVFTGIFDAIWAVAVSTNGKWWAASSRRGDVCVWSERGWTLHLAWRAHSDGILGLAFSPDERILATGSWDGSVKLWDMESGALCWTGWHADLIVGVAWSPDGRMLASGAADGSVKLWDPHSGTNLRTLVAHTGTVNTVTFSPDSCFLASGGGSLPDRKSVLVIKRKSREERRAKKGSD